MTATEHVILVDENDNPVGIAEKIEAHRKNLRHRAFSVFLFDENDSSKLLLQQRAMSKYHSGGLWTNTCCSHPRVEEDILQAGQRRLQEEMHITAELTSAGRFHYIAHFNNGMVENEIDHVLVGKIPPQPIHPNPDEAKAWRWVSIEDLKKELKSHPEQFTPWFEEALEIAIKRI